ncbi:MAG: GxxExxY protein [Muribaculaceae bacterium]|nr:GxxExxY protein [Muribaculaceae bacterium]
MIDAVKLREHIYDVVGAIHQVHKVLGAGLNESCYQEGLQIELTQKNIPFKREVSFHPTYQGLKMEATFRIDFICKEDIIVECKSVPKLIGDHRAQLFNYMRLLKLPCGILVNFMPQYAEIERYFYDEEKRSIVPANRMVYGHRTKSIEN